MPEVIRYAKQQTNFWRDFSWSMTVGHARDWLAIHADSDETAEGLAAFYEKRPVDYEGPPPKHRRWRHQVLSLRRRHAPRLHLLRRMWPRPRLQ